MNDHVKDRVIEIPTGRRGEDGILELKPFIQTVVSLSIARVGERVPPLLLTRAQAVALRDALDELIPDMKEDASPDVETYVEGLERRRPAA
ncbi:MAG TPA: hypothetical protein VM911_12890 [Pyrinomonadaceae bacterium]|jgi:hypothetical protein|nr:hypothetical protein [Pyrinomonadaceae bacterium]